MKNIDFTDFYIEDSTMSCLSWNILRVTTFWLFSIWEINCHFGYSLNSVEKKRMWHIINRVAPKNDFGKNKTEYEKLRKCESKVILLYVGTWLRYMNPEIPLIDFKPTTLQSPFPSISDFEKYVSSPPPVSSSSLFFIYITWNLFQFCIHM